MVNEPAGGERDRSLTPEIVGLVLASAVFVVYLIGQEPTVSQEEAVQVRLGMTIQQVADALDYPNDEPDYVVQQDVGGRYGAGRFETYSWNMPDRGMLIVGFKNGVVVRKTFVS